MSPLRPTYEVVSPVGERLGEKISDAPAIPTLAGKTIGFVWTVFTNGDVLADAFADLLGKRFRGLNFIKLPSGKDLEWGDYPDISIGPVAVEAGVDAVIVAVGC